MSDETYRLRRSVLRAAGVAGIGAVAGCTGGDALAKNDVADVVRGEF